MRPIIGITVDAKIDPEDLRTKRSLAKWVRLGTAYARSLPAKR